MHGIANIAGEITIQGRLAMEFRVIWEIEIEADSPKEAALEARVVQLTPGMSATVFDVWTYGLRKLQRIDLVDQPDRLDRDELFAVRAGLRLLQCKPDTPPGIQDVATVMLIFLDKDNMMFKKRFDVGPLDNAPRRPRPYARVRLDG
jgi:hypothetical protein